MYRIPLENEQITKALTTPFAPIDFTDAEKQQFRDNIGAEQAGRYSNLNLLDNPWFTVNQRNASGLLTATGYFVDRWKNDAANKVTVNGSTVVLSAGGQISQYYENIILEVGKTYTLSVLTDSGAIFSWSKVYEDVATFRFVAQSPWEIGFAKSAKRLYIYNNAGVSIKAIKLELGSVSTLANDSAPDYATELMKCSRYFQKISITGSSPWNCATIRQDGAVYRSVIPLMFPMRTNIVSSMVTMTNATSLYISGGGYQVQVQSYVAVNSGRNMAVAIDFTCNGTTIPYRTSCLLSGSGVEATVSVSADL